MSSENSIQVEGSVVEVMTGGVYRVEVRNGHRVVAHLTGKLRLNAIQLEPGHTVTLEMSPFDLSQARIISVVE